MGGGVQVGDFPCGQEGQQVAGSPLSWCAECRDSELSGSHLPWRDAMENLSRPVQQKHPLSPGVCRTPRCVQGGDTQEQKMDTVRSSRASTWQPEQNKRK